MSTQYRLVVGKDCQRRLLSRPRFVRAVAPRIIIIIIISFNILLMMFYFDLYFINIYVILPPDWGSFAVNKYIHAPLPNYKENSF
jgi:hypothetical protein